MELSDKQTRVVPCTSQQGGLVAMIEMDPSLSGEENAERLSAAVAGVRVGCDAPAARDDAQQRLTAGDAVGFIGEEKSSPGACPNGALAQTMAALADGAEILTIVCGDGAPIPLAEIEAHAPDGAEVELHDGGQPHYWWRWLPKTREIRLGRLGHGIGNRNRRRCRPGARHPGKRHHRVAARRRRPGCCWARWGVGFLSRTPSRRSTETATAVV